MRRSGRRVDRAKIVRDGRAPCRVSPGYVRIAAAASRHLPILVNAKSSGGHDVRPATMRVAGESAEIKI